MIAIDDGARPLPRTVLDPAGGFAWWYVDHLGADGAAVVLIPSFGLPFLPGHGGAARAGRAPPASAAPSLAVSVVHRDRPAFYLLQRYAPSQASWSEGELRLGNSRFFSERKGDRHVFHAEIDCSVPHTTERLCGVLHLEGPAHRLATTTPASPHRWTPLTAGTATVDLTVGDRTLASGPGRAYHDRNGSDVPLHALGIREWVWSRNAFPDGELVTYTLWPESGGAPEIHAYWLRRDGRFDVVADGVVTGRRSLGRFGMPWWRRMAFEKGGRERFTLDTRAVVDDGPFYLRLHTEARRADGAVGPGVAEVVRPGRVDLAPLRPLVRMAVHDTAGPNSPWLPLFSGTLDDRWARLLATRRPALLGAAP